MLVHIEGHVSQQNDLGSHLVQQMKGYNMDVEPNAGSF